MPIVNRQSSSGNCRVESVANTAPATKNDIPHMTDLPNAACATQMTVPPCAMPATGLHLATT